MRLQNLFTIVALVALAALVGLVVRSLVSPSTPVGEAANVQRQGPAQSNLPQIWVVRDTLEVGTFIEQADFEARDWPQAAILAEHLRVGTVQPGDIAGAVVRERMVKGEPVLMAKLVRPGERGFLAAVLLPGMRAVSVGVDSVSASSGLVVPGDRVDVILTQNLASTGSGSGRSHVGETIVRAARVLAVGKDLNAPADSAEVDDRPQTMTLEVTPKQAEAISVAVSLGEIKLALRSLGATSSDQLEDELATSGADLTKPEGPTWADSVSEALGSGSNMQVMRGSNQPSAR